MLKNKMTKEFILSLSKRIINNNCWIYDNATVISFSGKSYRLHRVVAYLWHGGFNIFTDHDIFICHRCENDTNKFRVCFNPEHLYVGNSSTNMFDAVKKKTHVKARNTHCPRGHEYNGFDKRKGKITNRHCSICRREALRRWKKRKKDEKITEV